jgi:hypothetical protein
VVQALAAPRAGEALAERDRQTLRLVGGVAAALLALALSVSFNAFAPRAQDPDAGQRGSRG